MIKKLVIAGSGGLAKEVKELVEAISSPFEFIGFVGPEEGSHDNIMNDKELIGSEEELSVAIAIGNPKIVEALYQRYRINPKLTFPNIIHPSSHISPSLKKGIGNVFFSNVLVSAAVTIGDFNIIYPFNFIGHDVEIGRFNLITPHCSLSGHVKLGNRCIMGTGSRTIPSIHIADDTMIGAGAVIVRDITRTGGTHIGAPSHRI